jgi:hypothetical protein
MQAEFPVSIGGLAGPSRDASLPVRDGGEVAEVPVWAFGREDSDRRIDEAAPPRPVDPVPAERPYLSLRVAELRTPR